MAGNQVRIGVGVKDNASKPIKGISDAFHRLQTQGGKGFAIGAGAAATAKAFDLVGLAVGAVTNYLGEAAAAYREDQASVVQLNQALLENIDGWNGNTDAIERALDAGMKLGFADETQRQGLTKLVAAYGDVTKALEVERLAMDIARFSGMSLADASDVLIKVHAGSYRALKSLGISTKDVKNETQALGLIYDKVKGQAAAYAATSQGKIDAANIRISESQERAGKVLDQFWGHAAEIAARALDYEYSQQVQADENIAAVQKASNEELLKLAQEKVWKEEALQKQSYARSLLALQDYLKRTGQTMGDLAKADTRAEDAMIRLARAEHGVADAASDAEGATQDLRTEFDKTKDATKDLDQAISDLSGALFGMVQIKGDIAQTAKDLADLKKAGPDSKSRQDADIFAGAVGRLTQRLFEQGAELAKAQGPQAYYDWVQRNTAITTGMSSELIALMVQLRAAALLSSTLPPIGFVKGYVDPINKGRPTPGQARAHGGPISPNQPYVVGEKGPELIVPTSSGNVIPNNRLGSGVTVNLTVQGDLRARSKEDVVSALQRAAAFIR